MPAWFYQDCPHWLVWSVLALLIATVAWILAAMKIWANGLRFDPPPRITYDECGYGSPAWTDAARAAVSISRRRDMHALAQEVSA